MSLDTEGFSEPIQGGKIVITITPEHRLLKLARHLSWEDMLNAILPDLQRTERKRWWVGRPLRVRIHLGIYILQQMLNLTDRGAEQQLQDNAAFRLFCGNGLMKHWHVPDHTKIEAFRSRLTAETQRKLANLMSQQAVHLGYANPAHLDMDSTIQEANIAYPAKPNLLLKVAALAKKVGKALNQRVYQGEKRFNVALGHLRQIALYYFQVKRKNANNIVLKPILQRLWRETYENILPILQHSHQLTQRLKAGKDAYLRRTVEKRQWRGANLIHNLHTQLFEKNPPTLLHPFSLHAQEITCFNKGKLNQKLQFGRAYQLGRIEGNFLFVTECASLHMPDAQSLPDIIDVHEQLFGKNILESTTTDKGYYAYGNEWLLKQKGVKAIYLPRPRRTLFAPPEKTPWSIQQVLHNCRAGIEPLIGHAKHGGQLRKSRMKSDETTKSAGYAAILGFNLRQLTRYLTGEVPPKSEKMDKIAANDGEIELNKIVLTNRVG